MRVAGSDGVMSTQTPDHRTSEYGSGENTHEYQVIARRFRPRSFDEVVGQEAVADALKQSILQNRLAHAYLFCGPRGVGKTSMARIFAAALQCPHTKDAIPCGKCATCERIFRGEDSDVTEMDGASNRGIDDIRGLIEHVQYAPTQGRYRVFILDEVHMLTRDAFNALLKTLEEPPAHVKFVFATTEPERILPTVLSRCQRCDFSSISHQDIARRLEQVCQQEGAEPGPGLLEEVATLARGGMRDAQSLLDQILAFAGKEPQLEDLLRITGRVSSEELEQLISILETGDLAAAIQQLTPILDSGTEPSVLTDQLIAVMRDQLHLGVASGWTPEKIEANLLAQEILQETRQRLRQQDRGDLVLELALLRIGTLPALVRTGSHSSANSSVTASAGTSTVIVSSEQSGSGKQSDNAKSEEGASSKSEVAREMEPSPVTVTEEAPAEHAAVADLAASYSSGEETADEAESVVATGKSRAQAALDALKAKPAAASEDHDIKSKISPEDYSEPAVVSSEPSDSQGTDAFEDLVARVAKISSLTARHLSNDGHLLRATSGWRFIVSESLEKVIDSPEVTKVLNEWQKVHGEITIEQGDRPRPSIETDSGEGVEAPQVIREAEEIFRAKAHRKQNQ
ncbi:MAG: hypothetical protein CBC13_04020 [Planctomycetia bacterium TMED53]|nr:MAG: hypothetical protein CBC13_04020 [Planctomycetia bacterium TMED53]